MHLFLTAVLLITLFPLIYTISSSFKTNAEILTNPAAIFSESAYAEKLYRRVEFGRFRC